MPTRPAPAFERVSGRDPGPPAGRRPAPGRDGKGAAGLDIWEEWLTEGRYSGASAQEREYGHQFIDTARLSVEAEIRLQPGESVLEAGCGAGDWLPRLLAATPGGTVFALDVSPALIERARQSLAASEAASEAGRVRWLCQDLREALPAEVRVNAVCGRSVLQYTGEALPDVLAGLHRALLPGGRIGFFEATRGDDAPPLPQDLPAHLEARLRSRWSELPWTASAAGFWSALEHSPFRRFRVQSSRLRSMMEAGPQLLASVLAARPCPGEGPLGEVLLRDLDPEEARQVRESYQRADRLEVSASWCLLAADA